MNRDGTEWTTEDDSSLRTLAGTKSPLFISARLRRSVNAIRRRARELKLSLKSPSARGASQDRSA
jgi:hypothetical protein